MAIPLVRLLQSTSPRFDFAPYALRFINENVTWQPGTNQIWDLTAFLDAVGISPDAKQIVVSWGASRYGPTCDFTLLDRNNVNLGTFRYFDDHNDNAFGSIAPLMGTPVFIQPNVRKLDYGFTGGHFHDYTTKTRYFIIWGWF